MVPEARTFLDANVLLEIVSQRTHARRAEAFLRNHKERLVISTLTVHIVVYFGRKVTDLMFLKRFLDGFVIVDLNDNDVAWAFTNIRNDDFEDALQIAVAVRHGCERFVTFDRTLVKAYKDTSLLQFEAL